VPPLASSRPRFGNIDLARDQIDLIRAALRAALGSFLGLVALGGQYVATGGSDDVVGPIISALPIVLPISVGLGVGVEVVRLRVARPVGPLLETLAATWWLESAIVGATVGFVMQLIADALELNSGGASLLPFWVVAPVGFVVAEWVIGLRFKRSLR
jgi:hypothetical protein